MRTCSERIIDLFALLGIAVACLLLTLFILPPLEEGREHARKRQAWITVRRLSAATDAKSRKQLLVEADPWGQPYLLETLADGGIRAVSSGPNMSSPAEGLDEDDIYSDMPESPNAAKDRSHDLHMLSSLAMSAAVWLFASLCYVRYRIGRDNEI